MDVDIQFRFVPNIVCWKWNASFSSLQITDRIVYINLWSVQTQDLHILGDISYILDSYISLLILLKLYILVSRIFRDTWLNISMLRMTDYRFKCHHLNVGEQYHYHQYVDFYQLWRLCSPLDAYIRNISLERFLFRFKWMHLLSILYFMQLFKILSKG